MADPIETWRIEQFKNNVQHLLQEKGGKLRSTVTFAGDYAGKGAAPVDQMGETEAVDVSERYGDSPNMEVPTDRRWIYPIDSEWGKLVDDFDRVRLGIQPDGEYEKAGVMAMARREDRRILEKFFATAKSGESGGTNKSFAGGNEVAVNLTDPGVTPANTGLNKAKLLKAREILGANEVDLENEELYIAVTEKEVTDLFGYDTMTSVDFVEGRPISTGRLPALLGFNFVPFSSSTFTKLSLLAAGTASLPVWVKSGMHLGVWGERKIDVGPDPAKKFNQRIYMKQTMGATRLEEGKVVRILSYHA